jgi:outer membrane protein TolC
MQAALDAAAAKIESAGALDDPMLSYAVAPNTFGYPGQGINQNIQISQTFPWPGTLDLRSDAATAAAKSARYQLADVRLKLAAQARAAFADWYYVHHALQINAKNQTLLARLKQVAETEYKTGQAPQQDMLQAEVELTRLKNQALQLHARRRGVQAKINALLNREPRATVRPPADLATAPNLPTFAALGHHALAQYPTLKALNAQLAANQDRIKLAEKSYYPNFKLMAGYNSLWDAPDKRLIVGASINIPFGGNHRGALDAAHARLRQTTAKLANTRAKLLGNLQQSYAAVEQARKTIKLYTNRLVPLARLNFKAAESDYRSTSNSDFLKLVTAERQYLMAGLEKARARANLLTRLASLNYQTGGAVFPHDPSAAYQNLMP